MANLSFHLIVDGNPQDHKVSGIRKSKKLTRLSLNTVATINDIIHTNIHPEENYLNSVLKVKQQQFFPTPPQPPSTLQQILQKFFLNQLNRNSVLNLDLDNQKLFYMIANNQKKLYQKTNEQKWKFIFQKIISFLEKKLLHTLNKHNLHHCIFSDTKVGWKIKKEKGKMVDELR